MRVNTISKAILLLLITLCSGQSTKAALEFTDTVRFSSAHDEKAVGFGVDGSGQFYIGGNQNSVLINSVLYDGFHFVKYSSNLTEINSGILVGNNDGADPEPLSQFRVNSDGQMFMTGHNYWTADAKNRAYTVKLDESGTPVFESTYVNAAHTGRKEGIDITYDDDGNTYVLASGENSPNAANTSSYLLRYSVDPQDNWNVALTDNGINYDGKKVTSGTINNDYYVFSAIEHSTDGNPIAQPRLYRHRSDGVGSPTAQGMPFGTTYPQYVNDVILVPGDGFWNTRIILITSDGNGTGYVTCWDYTFSASSYKWQIEGDYEKGVVYDANIVAVTGDDGTALIEVHGTGPNIIAECTDTYGATNTNIAITPNKSIVLSGYISSGSDDDYIVTYIPSDAAPLYIDCNKGDVVELDGESGDDRAIGVAAVSDNSLIVTGTSYSTANGNDYLTAKISFQPNQCNTFGGSFCPGDMNGDGELNVNDLTYFVNYLFKGGPAPDPLEASYVTGDCSGIPGVNELVYLVNYFFKGGPAPVPCP